MKPLFECVCGRKFLDRSSNIKNHLKSRVHQDYLTFGMPCKIRRKNKVVVDEDLVDLRNICENIILEQYIE
jgi:hypothetical protein